MTMENEETPAPEPGPSKIQEGENTLAEPKPPESTLSSQRYGREDEEVMGLKFCNEAVMCLSQLYPPPEQYLYGKTPLQEALMKRLGANAYPFTMEITPLAPPSVQLVPAKEYNGAPIGTSYDVRAYVAERIDEKLHKRTTVRMGIRVVQRAFAPPSPYRYVPGGGKTTKEQAKMNRKALLYGCKSALLDNRFFLHDSGISRSAETVGTAQENPQQIDNEFRSAHRSMPECRRHDIDSTNEDSENKSPNLKPIGHVKFDERQKPDAGQKDSPMVNGQGSGDGDKRNEDYNDGLDKRRMSLKCGGPEVRTDSVESNEDRISDYYRSLCSAKRPSMAAYVAGVPNPHANVEKPFLLSDGKVCLSASLDKGIYSHGEDIRVSVQIKNNSSKTIKRIKVFVVQHVDVCMFSNGKFKNVVAMLNDKESCPIPTSCTLNKTYTLLPLNSSTKNWIALEDTYTKSSSSLASTVCSVTGNAEDRNVFAIYVSYYVKVKLLVSVMGGDVSLKLPFTLMHTCNDYDGETLTKVKKIETDQIPHVVVEINKTDNKSPTNTKERTLTESEVPKRPSTLHLCKNGATDDADKEKHHQNLDEIIIMGKSDSEVENLSTIIKQNGAQHLDCRQTGVGENHGAFFSLSRAFCCLRTRRSS
ncbi:unnamed protein product [Ceutorhynchus assimilis]|uniref:Arrestin C-terminal-like domain-containing protein n=1 Tax=Ceutorhynchus assimilis TaxID=467358 RepID=A0A9N9MPA1_9CUCU|nr:unnamed protein product [Ceutorhynchus assimilis]